MDGIILDYERSFLLENVYDIQFVLLFGGMVVLFLLEGFLSRNSIKKDQTNRWLSNVFLALFNYFFLIVIMLFFSSVIYRFSPSSPILQSFELSDIPNFIAVLVVMEFAHYWIHRVNHKIPLLWRIHRVHHSDINVDVTTSYRHHPFEAIVGALMITPIVLVLGAPAISIAIYNLTRILSSLLTHSDILISDRINKYLELFIVTPNFHRAHHSSERKYTDSNYSAIIPLFDYVFKTSNKLQTKQLVEMELGLETMRSAQDNKLGQVLASPFK